MLDAARDDEKLAHFESDDAIAEVDVEMSIEDKEQLILILVMMPDELAGQFHDLHVLPVQLTNNARAAQLRELR